MGKHTNEAIEKLQPLIFATNDLRILKLWDELLDAMIKDTREQFQIFDDMIKTVRKM